jgi:hypothetical protein
MTVGREFFIKATTGDILLFCQQIIMFRCPLCMSLFTENVMKSHFEADHKLEIK